VTAKTAPVAAKLSTSEMTALVARGDALFATGDVTNARLFYRRGADGGDGPAALRLGESFDPAFLAQAGVGHVPGDAKEAAYWYWRALDLGVRDAALLLQSLHLARPQ
jgi:TPR repeat protein